MTNFTPGELRRAAWALDIIQERGCPDAWAHILREACSKTNQSDDPWHYATLGQKMDGQRLADNLAGLLGESGDACERAVAEVFLPQAHRAAFNALLAYAKELQTAKDTPEDTSWGGMDVLDYFNKYGLGAMLDYSCVASAPDEPEPRHHSEPKPKTTIRLVAEGGA